MKESCRNYLPVIALSAVFFLVAVIIPKPSSATSINDITKRGYLLWGADAEGGAPYVFPDPDNPNKLIGFEVDLANAIARELGTEVKMSQNAWDSLIPALERGDFDMTMNGIEITAQRKERILFSQPYYIYTEQLVVRKDEENIKSIKDIPGKKVGTLSGAVAVDILRKTGGVEIKIYPGQVEPYEDLALGRLDAVLLDLPIAAYYAKPNHKLKYAGEPVGEGFYAIAFRKRDTELKERVDAVLSKLLRTGELKKIYEKWDLWNEPQEKLLKNIDSATNGATLEEMKSVPLKTFFPTLLKGAVTTIFISSGSMALAITLGLAIVILKLYSKPPLNTLASAYIELYRGTPLLIQLFILYYGLPNIGLTLSPLTAAILGLGMNYAAYEAEIYRAGIKAIPKGQTEAAYALGMTQALTIRRIVFPQAVRIAIPGITNDFIALFKDSSLVSVIAMVELTKTYSILAASTLRFFELGLITAFLYFAMSYPLSLLARRLEARLKG